MARIRTIKPDAFKSESLSSVSRGARWTFAGLWTYCDDAGIGRADPRLIKAELYPLDDSTTAAVIDEDMNELIDAGCLHTFMSGGKVYIHIPGTKVHQKINRPTPSVLPACSCTDHQRISDSSVSPHGDVSWEGKGRGREREREGERVDAARPPRSCAQHPKGTDTPCGRCKDARTAHDAWRPATFTGPQTKCGDHPTRPALNCPDCAAEVTAPTEDVLTKVRSLAKKKSA